MGPASLLPPPAGVYDVVNNLSSLVARFIFQPIEESFYVFFACTLLRGEPASRQPTASLQVAMTTLARLLKLVVVISLVILVFGYSYSHLALRIYGGALLTDSEGKQTPPPRSGQLQHCPPPPSPGPILMRFFCAYIPLLALNGITECFFFALMSQAEIDRSVLAAGDRVPRALSQLQSSSTPPPHHLHTTSTPPPHHLHTTSTPPAGTTGNYWHSLPSSSALLSC